MKRRSFLAGVGLAIGAVLGITPKPIVAAPMAAPVLRDLYLSPKAMADIRNWAVYEIDEKTRREIYNCDFNVDKMYSSTIV